MYGQVARDGLDTYFDLFFALEDMLILLHLLVERAIWKSSVITFQVGCYESSMMHHVPCWTEPWIEF